MSAHQLSGFRLDRLEVRNWGTFDRRVWVFPIGGLNALLTGNIGSGKSTLIDAVTALLVGAHRARFNKAAGADTSERSLRSYVLGHYRSERGDVDRSRPVGLREEKSACATILASFTDAVLAERITIAQVFWFDGDTQPDRLFVVADGEASIKEDFSDFGPTIAGLRKRLRSRPGTHVFTSYSDYAAAFRRRMGIDGEHALELFHQTVSMKSVGDLTEFVRTHMLEAAPVAERIEDLLKHFADLDRAHQAVENAKQQINALRPLVADGVAHAALQTVRGDLDGCHGALAPWLASRRVPVITAHLVDLASGIRADEGSLDALKVQKVGLETELKELAMAIGRNGGDRLQELERLERDAIAERDRRTVARNRCAGYCQDAGLPMPADAGAFANLQEEARQQRLIDQETLQRLDNEHTEAAIARREAQGREAQLVAELASLRTRRTNIDAESVAVRQRLIDAIGGIDAEDLPFAGEIIQVRSEAQPWRGAIERVLRGLGRSLLVPSEHYQAVATWVNQTRLFGFRYYHVVAPRIRHVGHLHRKSLVAKVEVQPRSWAYDWIEHHLRERYDWACCDTIEELRNEEYGVTITGQKKQGQRHEKDDSIAIDNTGRYILGWSNETKIQALEVDLQAVQLTGRQHLDAEVKLDRQRKKNRDRDQALGRILDIERWEDIHPTPSSAAAASHAEERRQLTAGSSPLAALQKSYGEREQARTAIDTEYTQIVERVSERRNERTRAEQQREAALAEVQGIVPNEAERWFVRLEALRQAQPETAVLRWDGSEQVRAEWSKYFTTQIKKNSDESAMLRDRVVGQMTDVRRTWQILTQELDNTVDAVPAYTSLLQRLEADDLPRFQEDFKNALQENTIKEVVNFKSMLEDNQRLTRIRIAEINASLQTIDYNPGRFIELIATPESNPEIEAFRQQLRTCTEHVYEAGEITEAYSEQKYLDVRAIIDRFRGRDGFGEIDRRWRDLVTDVRNWTRFGASERNRSDGTEHEHYDSSSGKSGGQKEKLAYTVLAASIAFRYGLGDDSKRRSFRFVVIDEAFGRGSEDSARFGLDLFERLGLQVLVATPLQKIAVIEPYVANVGFVSNDDRESYLRPLSIEAFRAEQQARSIS